MWTHQLHKNKRIFINVGSKGRKTKRTTKVKENNLFAAHWSITLSVLQKHGQKGGMRLWKWVATALALVLGMVQL